MEHEHSITALSGFAHLHVIVSRLSFPFIPFLGFVTPECHWLNQIFPAPCSCSNLPNGLVILIFNSSSHRLGSVSNFSFSQSVIFRSHAATAYGRCSNYTISLLVLLRFPHCSGGRVLLVMVVIFFCVLNCVSARRRYSIVSHTYGSHCVSQRVLLEGSFAPHTCHVWLPWIFRFFRRRCAATVTFWVRSSLVRLLTRRRSF